MGFPPSLTIADIFIEAFESLALVFSPYKLKVQFRYIDDTSIIWPLGREVLRNCSQIILIVNRLISSLQWK